MTEKLRREKINLMLTSNERKLILEKAVKYGYGNKISDYAREACLNERFYIEEIKGKKEICESANEYAVAVREYSNKLDTLIKKPTLSTYDCEFIKNQNIEINKSINDFIDQIIHQLSIYSVQKFQKRLRLIEKYKVTDKFIDRVIKNKFILTNPSSLTSKNISKGVIAIFLETCQTFVIENADNTNLINYSAIGIIIDGQRELALQRNCYLLFKFDGKNIFIYLADYYKTKEEAEKKIGSNKSIELYICEKKEG